MEEDIGEETKVDGDPDDDDDDDDDDDSDADDDDDEEDDREDEDDDDEVASAVADLPLHTRMIEVVAAISKLEIDQVENTERITTAVHGAGNRPSKFIAYTLWASISKLTDRNKKTHRRVHKIEGLANDAVASAAETPEALKDFKEEFLHADVFDEFTDD